MKSKITNEKRIEYPVLMQSRKTGVIVLFIGYKSGTVVHGVSEAGHSVGAYIGNGASTYDWDMSYFEKYTGTVELSN